jgi:hypothetical protein
VPPELPTVVVMGPVSVVHVVVPELLPELPPLLLPLLLLAAPELLPEAPLEEPLPEPLELAPELLLEPAPLLPPESPLPPELLPQAPRPREPATSAADAKSRDGTSARIASDVRHARALVRGKSVSRGARIVTTDGFTSTAMRASPPGEGRSPTMWSLFLGGWASSSLMQRDGDTAP